MAHYCSRLCQKRHWTKHKPQCLKTGPTTAGRADGEAHCRTDGGSDGRKVAVEVCYLLVRWGHVTPLTVWS